MKRSALWWEGAEWARNMIGQSEGAQALGICDNLVDNLVKSTKPQDYKNGALALVAVARKEAGRFVQK